MSALKMLLVGASMISFAGLAVADEKASPAIEPAEVTVMTDADLDTVVAGAGRAYVNQYCILCDDADVDLNNSGAGDSSKAYGDRPGRGAYKF